MPWPGSLSYGASQPKETNKIRFPELWQRYDELAVEQQEWPNLPKPTLAVSGRDTLPHPSSPQLALVARSSSTHREEDRTPAEPRVGDRPSIADASAAFSREQESSLRVILREEVPGEVAMRRLFREELARVLVSEVAAPVPINGCSNGHSTNGTVLAGAANEKYEIQPGLAIGRRGESQPCSKAQGSNKMVENSQCAKKAVGKDPPGSLQKFEQEETIEAELNNMESDEVDRYRHVAGASVGTVNMTERNGLEGLAQLDEELGVDALRANWSPTRFVVHHFHNQWNWFMNLREPEREDRLAKIVDGSLFKLLSGMIIIIHSACVVAALNHKLDAIERGYGPEDLVYTWHLYYDYVFLFMYIAELVLRIYVHRLFFFVNENYKWNWLDTFVVFMSIADTVRSLASGQSGGGGAAVFRLLRILKLGKTMRVLRIINGLRELRLILQVLTGSLPSLFWSIMMMFLMFYIFGLAFMSGVAEYATLHRDNMDPAEIELLLDLFGSMQNTMLSLFKACTGGDDWSLFYDTLVGVGPEYGVMFIAFMAFCQVSLMNILTALFVENASKLALPDRDELVFRKRKDMVQQMTMLEDLVRQIDTRKTGYMSDEDLEVLLANATSSLRLFIEAEGLDVSDARLFFRMLQQTNETMGDGRREVDIKAFVTGCVKIRGNASSLDMQSLGWQAQLMHRLQIKTMDVMKQELAAIKEDQAQLTLQSSRYGAPQS